MHYPNTIYPPPSHLPHLRTNSQSTPHRTQQNKPHKPSPTLAAYPTVTAVTHTAVRCLFYGTYGGTNQATAFHAGFRVESSGTVWLV